MKLLVIGKKGRLAKQSKPGQMEKYEIAYVDPGSSVEDILAAGQDADFILVDAMAAVPGEVIRNMPNLKMIHSEGVGFQGVDCKTAKECGVYVCNCKGMNKTPVAETAIMLMLACLKELFAGNKAVLSAQQIQRKERWMLEGNLRELADCSIGFIGFGDIAKEAARLARAFGVEEISYYDVVEAPAELSYGAVRKELDEVLASSDIVSLHLPVFESTKDIANKDFFAKMKDGAIIINTARGELLKSEDLIEAIASGHIAAAGLDCIAGEPVKADNVMLQADPAVLEKIVFSPHIGGITASSFKRGYQMVWENIDRAAAGEKPVRVVNGL